MGVKGSTITLVQFSSWTIIFLVQSVSGALAMWIFLEVNPILGFCCYFSFLIALFAKCYLISTLFSRPVLAGLGSILLITALGLLSACGLMILPESFVEWVPALCFIPQFAMSLILFNVSNWMFENAEHGYGWGDALIPRGGISVCGAIGCMAASFAVFLTLGMYLQAVLPSKYGVRHKFWFMFSPTFWGFCKKPAPREINEHNQPGDGFQMVPESIRENLGLSIRGLRKCFKVENGKELVAVNNISLDMYNGQVLSLL
eukprot:398271_1